MITMDQARTLQGKKLLGQGGEHLGTIDVLYADREGNEPTFATVHTGLFGSKTSFVPLASADVQGEDVVVPYDKEIVKRAQPRGGAASVLPLRREWRVVLRRRRWHRGHRRAGQS